MSKRQVFEMTSTRRRTGATKKNPLPVVRINGNLRFRKVDVDTWASESGAGSGMNRERPRQESDRHTDQDACGRENDASRILRLDRAAKQDEAIREGDSADFPAEEPAA